MLIKKSSRGDSPISDISPYGSKMAIHRPLLYPFVADPVCSVPHSPCAKWIRVNSFWGKYFYCKSSPPLLTEFPEARDRGFISSAWHDLAMQWMFVEPTSASAKDWLNKAGCIHTMQFCAAVQRSEDHLCGGHGTLGYIVKWKKKEGWGTSLGSFG